MTVLANTAVCVYVSLVCRYVAPLVSVIRTLLCCVIFHHRVWYCALSLRYACIRSSDIIIIP